jgi:hypothetical protein
MLNSSIRHDSPSRHNDVANMYRSDSGQLSPVGRMLQKSCGSTQRHGPALRAEKMLQNQFPGAFEAQRCIRNGRIRIRRPVSSTSTSPERDEVWLNLKAVISAEGAKFNTSPGRNVRPENQRPCQSQVHNREECRPFGNDKVVYIGEVQGTITMFGTVVRIELSRIAWVGGWRRTSISKMQLAYCMTVHKAQGLNSPTLCRRSQHTDHGQRT